MTNRAMKMAVYFAAAIFLALMVSPTYADLLVLPNDKTSALGNDSSGSLAGSIPSLHVQDIWDKGQFSAVPDALLITSFAFRLKPGTGSISGTVTSGDLHMSTTSYTTTTMTSTFATNRGADYTLVASLGSGTIFSSPGCTALVTCPFDVVFTLSTPFLYDPSKGNLLLELEATGYNGVGTG